MCKGEDGNVEINSTYKWRNGGGEVSNEMMIREYEGMLWQLRRQLDELIDKLNRQREEIKEREELYEKAIRTFREVVSQLDVEERNIGRLGTDFPKTKLAMFAGRHLALVMKKRRIEAEKGLEDDIRQNKREIMMLYDDLDTYMREKSGIEERIIYYENELIRLRSEI